MALIQVSKKAIKERTTKFPEPLLNTLQKIYKTT
jgi:hypothetical protein